ncbi:MAG: hypothetical protein HY812_09285 [Planctomycetes bacterium]|nr:hypothetical protein [Planctomycetota bacterium]
MDSPDLAARRAPQGRGPAQEFRYKWADAARAAPNRTRYAGAAHFENGCAVGEALELQSNRVLCGDLEVDLALASCAEDGEVVLGFGADPIEVALRRGPEAEIALRRGEETLARAGLPAPHAGALCLSLVARGGAVEASLDGAPLVAYVREDPFAGGPIRVAIRGGRAALDEIAVRRLPWRDGVELPGETAARAAALAGQPLERFSLLAPLPSRIDPEFRVAVAGEEEPLVARICGVRRTAEDVPLLEQALALLRIRPYLKVRVLLGDEEAPAQALGESGPFVATGAKVIVEADALVGTCGDWPALTIWDAARERILDRTLPGGPAGRAARAELPPESDRVLVVLTIPGQEALEREIVIRRT